MNDNNYAIEQMQINLRTAKDYEDRARALDNLGSILKCEYPGAVHEVTVTKGRWWHRNKTDQNAVTREIVLSDDERREFAVWCVERSTRLSKQSEELKLKYALNG